MVIRYWLWTEKVAVPGFCFLSGYFGKGFLRRGAEGGKETFDSTTVAAAVKKDSVRWEQTISTLLVGPLLWQVLTAMLGYAVTRAYIYHSPGELDGMINEIYTNGVPPYLSAFENLGTWYLFALLIWRTWTSVFLSRLRQSPVLVLSLAMTMSLLSAHTDRGDGPQDMRMRLFYFFPYYVAGLYTDETTWQRITTAVTTAWRLCRSGRHWFSKNTQQQYMDKYRDHEHREILPSLSSSSVLSNSSREQTSSADKASRLAGCCGVVCTLTICQVMDRGDLGWMYNIGGYELRPHLLFLFQYVLAGTAVTSVILIVKTISEPLFPFSHGNATLAIYEWHWAFANLLAWGSLPFTEIQVVTVANMRASMPSGAYDSFIEYCFSTFPPLPTLLMVHLVCYLVCVLLGSRIVWNVALKYVCCPNCKWLFP